MEAYPAEYVQHNLPFVVLSGLGSKNDLEPLPPVHQVLPGEAATSISCEIASVTGEHANQLLQEFLKADGTNAPWNGRMQNRRGNLLGFRIRTVGRDFILPPKKADAPVADPSQPDGPNPPAGTSWILHSPISPLSPVSPVFPDGVMTSRWIAKHQHYVPSVFISFFNFTTDPITNSLHDNQLKTEINKIKNQIQKSDHKTRYVVVLLSNKTILEAPDIEERLATIRRGTGLDPKNSFFFLPPNTSQVELRSFVISILSTLQPICVEYYRDLTKHARRKKGRGSIPPPTAQPTRGTSQTLSAPGWGVRYDFKLGVFAEFRQEMDAAQRHYSIALDSLFGSEGLFETTASWSPRWDEIRMLADVVAFRHIRCQLWNNYPTSAAQTWIRYKTRLKDLLDRRGKGSSNYGWEAWESRWAHMMAQMIQRTELPLFRVNQPVPDFDPLAETGNATFCPPEKQFMVGERLPPWELLHHAGYWYKVSADHAKRRYLIARDMPEEDRTPPGMSPATKVSSRNQTYDSYLVPEPHIEYPLPNTSGGFEHWKDIVGKLNAAIAEFEVRGQRRKVEQLRLEAARTLLHVKRYDDAFRVFRPLWEKMSWRKEGWWALASEVLWGLHECALRVHDAETYVATEWELYSQVFLGKTRYKYDLMGCLESFPQDTATENKLSVNLDSKEFASCLTVTFTFSEGEGNVGEPLQSQIVVSSTARPGSAPITLSSLAFKFEGCLSEIQLTHEANDTTSSSESTMLECALEETSPSTKAEQKPCWSGTSDLTLHPGQTKVYAFPIIFREAGDTEAVSTSFEISTDRFSLVYTDAESDEESASLPRWWLKSGSKVRPRKLNREYGATVKVLPKPPKMEIRLPNLREHYYTNEPIDIDIEILNKEDEETEAVLEVRLLGRSKDTLGYSWVDRGTSSPMKEVPPTLDGSNDVDLPGHVVGQLAQGASATQQIRFNGPSEPSDYALEVKVLYHVLSDRDIPISKTMIAELIFNSPFESSYDFTPRVHPDPWPSYFSLEEAESNNSSSNKTESTDAFGIRQKWHLRAKIASFAEETLLIKAIAVHTDAVKGGATCDISPEFDIAADPGLPMNPQDLHECSFNVDVQKLNLEERRTTQLETSLHITWQRSTPSSSATAVPVDILTTLPIPTISLPISEPRVLASATHSTVVPGTIHMDYTLENPTMHFLTFELAMEASEEFGFAGPKLRIVHALPLSRQTVRYNLWPLVEGPCWVTPQLRVVDRYFNQTLRVQGTDGLRGGKKGVGVWVYGTDGRGPE
ncbi:hypothetical protein BS50DRAFT_616268 [Corynespora cassiicola Philippines]|uniref:Uncharacterized protein n=1 Tax=Corynespora cassiicola Philippines TaxID=1448308 RepID=A0A2T2P5W2_CORCC|nr:hypothetical protein BS50DRAFT_616268 [Corynespora cassiicola Philippines]